MAARVGVLVLVFVSAALGPALADWPVWEQRRERGLAPQISPRRLGLAGQQPRRRSSFAHRQSQRDFFSPHWQQNDFIPSQPPHDGFNRDPTWQGPGHGPAEIGCSINGEMYQPGQSWYLPGCRRGTCVKFGYNYYVSEDRCKTEYYNSNYACVIYEERNRRYPHCCPYYKCNPEL
ncbi:uncharacterized protein LOC119103650 [Pollicipes pollicipes]|uniref:uncharacterized protein LOC119103650 n=1 Tax=Pollicipes pollicipes TaxID=41117 RepID=UPI00188579DD|nr:uncharacterized protein LOC119103650 [Pollicipes pollicipes]